MRRSRAGIGLTVLGVILLVLVILSCIPATVPRVFGYQIYTAISGEMAPEVPEDSLVYVRTQTGETIKPGDMAAYYSNTGSGAALGHVKENRPEEGALTVSDVSINSDVDPADEILMEVEYAQLLGTARLVIPKLGFLMTLVASTSGMIVLASAIVVSVALIMLGTWLREREKKNTAAEEFPQNSANTENKQK